MAFAIGFAKPARRAHRVSPDISNLMRKTATQRSTQRGAESSRRQ